MVRGHSGEHPGSPLLQSAAARDRPLLVDVTYAELTFPNDATGKPVQCTGILGLENRTP